MAHGEEPSATPQLRTSPAMNPDSTTTIGSLIEDFELIADQAVPYGLLPPRLGHLSTSLPHWRDLGRCSRAELTELPGVGDSALNAIVCTAHRIITALTTTRHPDTAAGAAAKLLGYLDTSTRTILETRVIPLDPLPTGEVATTLGCAKASVSRRTRRAESKLARMLEHPEHQDVRRHAQCIADKLGPYLPAELAERELAGLGLTPGTDTAALLLHVAGPYHRHQRWVENTQVDGRRHIETAAARAVDNGGHAVRTDELVDVLIAEGMHPEAVATYLADTYPTMTLAGSSISYTATTTSAMAAAVLHAHQRCMTISEIHAAMSSGHATVGTLATVLSGKSLFARATRTAWALRQWELPEYTGISEAIGNHIDNHGGRSAISELVADVHRAFPDISERSIRTYLTTPQYITHDGYARRRTPEDPIRQPRPLHRARGVYLAGKQEVRIAMPITKDLQRGSGRSVAVAIAHAAGIGPGGSRTFTNRKHKPITIAWVSNAANNARVGSLRTHTEALRAGLGDTLIVAFNMSRSTYTIATLDTSAAPAEQLAQLTGRDTSDPENALAEALGNPARGIRDALRRRGDLYALELLAAATLAPTN